ncbi:MAG: peptidase M28, partial [Bacteroidota bacterium]
MKIRLISSVVVLLWVTGMNGQEISEKSLFKTVSYLASDKLEGRGTGTEGEKKAAKFIAREFKKIGLVPKGDGG